MKKMFTLVAALGLFAIAQAQPSYKDNRQTDQRGSYNAYNNGNAGFYNNNTRRYDNDKFSLERNRTIARINREFDEKIERVRHNIFLGWREKQRRISILEAQRQQEIRMAFLNHRDHDRRDRW